MHLTSVYLSVALLLAISLYYFLLVILHHDYFKGSLAPLLDCEFKKKK